MIFAAPPSPYVGGELVRLATRQHVVALTFDGGATAGGLRSILATLKRENVPATFFVTGDFVRHYPGLARAIGHSYPVGDHTVHHLELPRLSSADVRREITAASTMIRRGTGRDPRPLFRFPYGARDARTLDICRRLGYVSVRWTVDTLGWMGASFEKPKRAVQRVVDSLAPGEIILMHVGAARDGSTIDAQALPGVIRAVRARGYRFVTLKGVKAPG